MLKKLKKLIENTFNDHDIFIDESFSTNSFYVINEKRKWRFADHSKKSRIDGSVEVYSFERKTELLMEEVESLCDFYDVDFSPFENFFNKETENRRKRMYTIEKSRLEREKTRLKKEEESFKEAFLLLREAFKYRSGVVYESLKSYNLLKKNGELNKAKHRSLGYILKHSLPYLSKEDFKCLTECKFRS